MKKVIITADDFGLCSEVNRAVIESHQKGFLTCASLMIAAKAADEAVALARQNPDLKVGLHLVLVEGYSILPQKEIPDLVDNERRFSNHLVRMSFRYFFSRKVREQIAKECEAQIEAFLATGLKIDHLNTHNHLHIHPTILKILLPLVKKYNIPAMRLPKQRLSMLRFSQCLEGIAAFPWVWNMKRALKKAHILHNDEIFGLYETGAMVEGVWLQALAEVREGVTEIYCHPAVQKSPILIETMPHYHHREEFEALLSSNVQKKFDEVGVKRISFGEIEAKR